RSSNRSLPAPLPLAGGAGAGPRGAKTLPPTPSRSREGELRALSIPHVPVRILRRAGVAVVMASLLAACAEDPPLPMPELALTIHAAPDALESENGTTPSAVLRAFLLED